MKLIYIIGAILVSLNCAAQIDTVFWFAAPDIAADVEQFDEPIMLRLSALENNASVTISQPANSAFTPINVSISANSTESVDLSSFLEQVECKYSEKAKKGLLISSTAPITAYYDVVSSYCDCNPELFSLKGSNALGTLFYIPFQNELDLAAQYSPTPHAAFIIVATKNNTIVKITPTKALMDHPAGATFSVTLNEGETYSATALGQTGASHPSGSKVESNYPIAITMSDDLVKLGGCADLIGDQLVPVSVLGTEYIVQQGYANAAGGERICIVATQNNTTISINGTATGVNLKAGETFMYHLTTESAHVKGSAPIYVLHISGFDCELGAALIPSINCRGSYAVPFVRATQRHFAVNIVIKKGFEDAFLINGQKSIITANLFAPVPGTNNTYVGAKIDLMNVIPVGIGSIISNSKYIFQMGIINGDTRPGCSYGYFSNFSIINSNKKKTICKDAAVALSPGAANQNFMWNDNSTKATLSTNKEGKYWCRSKIGECDVIDTFVVSKINLQLPNDTLIACNNSLQISATAGFETYSWNTGESTATITASETQSYIVTATKENCILSDTFKLDNSCNSSAYYRFCGCSMKDFGGEGYDAVSHGSSAALEPQCASSIFDQGYYFKGATQTYLKAENFPNIQKSFSAMAWIKPESFFNGGKTPVLTQGVSKNLIALWVAPQYVALSLNAGSSNEYYKTFPTSIPLNAFSHIAAVYDYLNQTIKVFVNGKLIGSDRYNYQIEDINEGFYIGSNLYGQTYFKGIIDEVRITNNPLQSKQIDSIYSITNKTKIDLGGTITLQKNETINLSAPNGFVAYKWQDGIQTQTYTASKPGKYWVSVTDNKGCIYSDTVSLKYHYIDSTYISNCENSNRWFYAATGDRFLWSNGSTANSIHVNITNNTTIWSETSSDSTVLRNYYFVTTQKCPLTVNNDTAICAGDSARLQATTTGDFRGWNPTLAKDTSCQWIKPSSTSTYTATAVFLQNNATEEGTFESSVSAFKTDYTEQLTVSAGTYFIGTTPYNSANSAWAQSFADHTSNAGKMMILASGQTVGKRLFYKTIKISNGAIYNFSCWLREANKNANSTPPKLSLVIDGISTKTINYPPNSNKWLQFSTQWTATKTGEIEISIRNENTNPLECYMAIDDIAFEEVIQKTDAITIKVNSLTAVTATANPTKLCFGQTTKLIGTGASTYTWSDGQTNNQTFEAIETTTYFVTGTDANKCKDTSHVTVTVLPLPTIGATSSLSMTCKGESIKLTGSGAQSYQWSNGATNGIAYAPTQSTRFKVTGTDSNNCTDTASVNVIVNAPIKPIIISSVASNSVCEGETITLSLNEDYNTYLWSTQETSSEITISNLGEHAIKVVVSDQNNCKDSSTGKVSIYPLPKVSAEASSPQVCLGSATKLMGKGALQYEWSSHITDNQLFTPQKSGSYFVTGTDGNKCTDTAKIDIEVLPLPQPKIISSDSDATICEDKTLTLSTTETFSNFLWSNNETSPSIAINTPGKHSIKLAVRDNKQCSNTDSIKVLVNPLPKVTILGKRNLCYDQDSQTVKISGLHVKWFQFDDTTQTALSDTNTYTVRLPKSRDSISLYVIVSDSNNCVSKTTPVTIYHIPEYTNLHIDGITYRCANKVTGEIFQLKGYLHDIDWRASQYSAYKPDKTSIIVNNLHAGVDTIWASTRDTNGCVYRAHKEVYTSPMPRANFEWQTFTGPMKIIYTNTSDSSIVPQINQKLGNSYLWTFWKLDSTWKHSNEVETTLRYPYGYHDVKLVVTNEYGCKDSILKTVFMDITDALYVPTVFDPNHVSPEISEFRPKGINLVYYEISIYDHWGNLLWFSNKLIDGQPLEGWKGTYNGSTMKSDVYIWKLKAQFADGVWWKTNNESEFVFGNFLLLR